MQHHNKAQLKNWSSSRNKSEHFSTVLATTKDNPDSKSIVYSTTCIVTYKYK